MDGSDAKPHGVSGGSDQTFFHKYKITEDLKKGSHDADVFRCARLVDGAKFIVKRIKRAHTKKEGYSWQIMREISLLLKGRGNPYIVQLEDYFICGDGVVYIVLEEALGDLLTLNCKLSTEDRLECILSVSRGLMFMRSFGIIHRDIKEQNVLVFRGGAEGRGHSGDVNLGRKLDGPVSTYHFKICDFNLCGYDGDYNSNVQTVWWRSPEVFELERKEMSTETVERIDELGAEPHAKSGAEPHAKSGAEPYDYKIDVWSLGIIAMNIVTGVMNFDGMSERQMGRGECEALREINKRLRDVMTPASLAKIPPDDLKFLQLLIDGMLAYGSRDRFTLEDIEKKYREREWSGGEMHTMRIYSRPEIEVEEDAELLRVVNDAVGWNIFSGYLKKCKGSSVVFERRKKTLVRVFSAVMDDISSLNLAEGKVDDKDKLPISECCYVVVLKMMSDYTDIISMKDGVKERLKMFDKVEALILKKYLWLF